MDVASRLSGQFRESEDIKVMEVGVRWQGRYQLKSFGFVGRQASACTVVLRWCLAVCGVLSIEPSFAAAKQDGDWTMPGKNYQGTRYSELEQITPENAGK